MSRHTCVGRGRKTRCKRWDYIEVPSVADMEQYSDQELQSMSFSPRFCIRFFGHDMRYLYTVSSNKVRLTRGVLDYLHDYNLLGPNKSRDRLYVCSQFDKEGQCVNGFLCRGVHCTLSIKNAQDAALFRVPSNATGAPNLVTPTSAEDILLKKLNQGLQAVNCTMSITSADSFPEETTMSGSMRDALSSEHLACYYTGNFEGGSTAGGGGGGPANWSPFCLPSDRILFHPVHSRWTSRRMYPTLPPGVRFQVALPNTPTPVNAYDSSELLVTRGALEYYELTMRNERPSIVMQHCAHYSKNGFCCFGADCQFVHVLHYKGRAENDLGSYDSEALRFMSSLDSTSAEALTRRGRYTPQVKQTPLSALHTGVESSLQQVQPHIQPLTLQSSQQMCSAESTVYYPVDRFGSSTTTQNALTASSHLSHTTYRTIDDLTGSPLSPAANSGCTLMSTIPPTWQLDSTSSNTTVSRPSTCLTPSCGVTANVSYLMVPTVGGKYLFIPPNHTVSTVSPQASQQSLYLTPLSFAPLLDAKPDVDAGRTK